MHIYSKGRFSNKIDDIVFETETKKELERLVDNIFLYFVLGFYIIKDNDALKNLYRNLRNEILHVCIKQDQNKQEKNYCYKGIRDKAKLDKFIEKNSGYIYKKLFKQKELIN